MAERSQHSNILLAFISLTAVIVIVSLIGFFTLGKGPEIIQGQAEADEYRVSSKVPGLSLIHILSVKVKVNEAEMKLTQVDNGLSLSKMVLCQLCGLPLNDEIRLADEDVESLTLPEYHVGDNVATALANREELRSLDLANKIYDQKVNITRAGCLPTGALTANYMVTNPSLVNGFERKFRGMWAVGAMVQIPIWNWGEGMYKVKAAKAEANIARYQLADAKEKVDVYKRQVWHPYC